jgi:DNA-binding SARP family transcriptional activator
MVEVARLRLFGDFALEDLSGAPMTLPLRKAEAMLAYLALAPDGSSSREKLAAILWGGSDQQRARQSLRQVLFALTKALSQLDLPLLRLESQSVRLTQGALLVDAVEFDRLLAEDSLDALSQACELYTGEFLSGFNVDAPEFEDWLASSRQMFHDAAMRAHGRLLTEQEKSGQLDPAIETATRALRFDPMREDIHRQLMQLYAAKGMRSSALNQYRTCREILQRELKVHPDAQTAALYRQILEQAGEDRSADGDGRVRDGNAGELAALTDQIERLSEASNEPSIDREPELNRLRYLMDEVGRAGGALALISGEPGVGKSHCLSAFVSGALRGGAMIATSRGRLADRALPLELWTEALENLEERTDNRPREESLRSLRQTLREAQSGPGATGGGDRRAVYDAIVAGIRKIAKDGLLILIFDDLHRADEESLRMLHHVVRNLRSSPVLVIGAAESVSLAKAPLLRDLLHDLQRDDLVTSIDLKPLSREQSIELAWQLQQVVGIKRDTKARLNRFWQLSEGNPRVIREAVLESAARGENAQSGETPLPAAVLDEAATRKIRLGETAQRLMSVAAVIGQRANYEVVIDATRIEGDQAADALEELAAERILTVDGEDIVFVHRRVQMAVYEELLGPRRKLLHAAVVRAIREVHAGHLEPHYQEIARHYSATGNIRDSISFELEAAWVELNRGLPASARRFFKRTIESARRIDGDEEATRAAVDAHLGLALLAEIEEDLDRVSAGLDAAEALAERLGKPWRCDLLYALRSRLEWVRGAEDRAYKLASRALAESERDGASGPWLTSERLMAHLHLAGGANLRALDGMERRLARSAERGLCQDEAETASVLGLLYAILGEFTEANRYCERSVRVAEAVVDEACMTACLATRGIFECWQGDGEAALATFDKALEAARGRGDLPRVYALTGFRGYALLTAERTKEAVAAFGEALALGERLNSGTFAALFKAWLAEASVGLAHDEDALRLGREALELASEDNQAWAHSIAFRALARVLVRPTYRDLHSADRSIRSAVAIQENLGLCCEIARSMVVHAKILRARGNGRRSSEIFAAASSKFAKMGLQVDSERAQTMAEALHPSSEGSV